MASFDIDNATPEIKKASIKIVGVGGCGGNAVNSMIRRKIKGVDFIVCNTDAQALAMSLSTKQIQIGKKTTKGFGAGFDPLAGKNAAEEDRHDIIDSLQGTDMLFVTAGMGKGTGTGASPVIASLAKKLGILTIGIVTSPFKFEGEKTKKVAEEGINQLRNYVDTLVIVENQKIFETASKGTGVSQAYDMANDILYRGAKGIAEIITKSGLVNVDFADVKNMLKGSGNAVIGSASKTGEDKGRRAATEAISNPMIDKRSIMGAKGILVNISGNVEIQDIEGVMDYINSEVGNDTRIVHGVVEEETMPDKQGIMVTIIATGFVHQESPESKDVQNLKTKKKNLAKEQSENQGSEKRTKKADSNDQQNASFISTVRNSGSNDLKSEEKIDKSNPEIPAYLRRIADQDS